MWRLVPCAAMGATCGAELATYIPPATVAVGWRAGVVAAWRAGVGAWPPTAAACGGGSGMWGLVPSPGIIAACGAELATYIPPATVAAA